MTFVITDTLVLSKDIGLKVNNIEKDCLKNLLPCPKGHGIKNCKLALVKIKIKANQF
jgi:hypothetical protein